MAKTNVAKGEKSSEKGGADRAAIAVEPKLDLDLGTGLEATDPDTTDLDATDPDTTDPDTTALDALEVESAAAEAEDRAEESPGAAPDDLSSAAAPIETAQDIDDLINALKALLSAVEKLQKVRQDVGDIKPLIVRMLDGDVMAGEELEQLKTGVAGLFRLTRAYSDHQAALLKAQPARALLDDVLKVKTMNN